MNRRFLLLISSFVFFAACSSDSDEGPGQITPDQNSSWGIIQAKIFENNCVSCHQPGNTFASQSGLVLTEDEAYSQLINVPAKNEAAKNDGLVRVGTAGIASLENSFLWEKINAPNFEHFYTDHPEYGELMPLNLSPLTNGEIEFIRQWISKGAPETGSVVNTDILNDSTRFLFPGDEFVAPNPPSEGLQIHLEEFQVQPNYERELFKYQAVGNSEDIYVNRIEITMRKGSHHFILYDFAPGFPTPQPDIIRDLRDENGVWNFSTLQSMAEQVFFFGTQLRITDYRFPSGVALQVDANKYLDLNSHYTNFGSDTIPGEVYVNFHTVPESEVIHKAENLFLNNRDIHLPANQVTTISKSWQFHANHKIFMLTSHAHQQMTEFNIYITGGSRDGELVYTTTDWEHPPLMKYDPPINLKPGEGLTAETTYDNNTPEAKGFGLLSTDEMMIIFGAYYLD